jgi:hypothetical protein
LESTDTAASGVARAPGAGESFRLAGPTPACGRVFFESLLDLRNDAGLLLGEYEPRTKRMMAKLSASTKHHRSHQHGS